jgi:hypothetical protein
VNIRSCANTAAFSLRAEQRGVALTVICFAASVLCLWPITSCAPRTARPATSQPVVAVPVKESPKAPTIFIIGDGQVSLDGRALVSPKPGASQYPSLTEQLRRRDSGAPGRVEICVARQAPLERLPQVLTGIGAAHIMEVRLGSLPVGSTQNKKIAGCAGQPLADLASFVARAKARQRPLEGPRLEVLLDGYMLISGRDRVAIPADDDKRLSKLRRHLRIIRLEARLAATRSKLADPAPLLLLTDPMARAGPLLDALSIAAAEGFKQIAVADQHGRQALRIGWARAYLARCPASASASAACSVPLTPASRKAVQRWLDEPGAKRGSLLDSLRGTTPAANKALLDKISKANAVDVRPNAQQQQVLSAVVENYATVTGCLAKSPGVAAKMVVTTSAGKVVGTSRKGNDDRPNSLIKCFQRVVRRWRFPAPPGIIVIEFDLGRLPRSP